MIVCIDADYRDTEAVTAGVGIRAWTDEVAALERVVRSPFAPEPYVPGSFYLRELPGTLALLREVPAPITTIVIDGYVWLGAERPGFGARLFAEVRIPVIGVAKTSYKDNDRAVPVVRGGSTRPLFVTSEGLDVNEAAARIASMFGPHRIPAILKRVDQLARGS